MFSGYVFLIKLITVLFVRYLSSYLANFSLDTAVAGATEAGAPTPETKLEPVFTDLVTQNKPKSEKDAYN